MSLPSSGPSSTSWKSAHVSDPPPPARRGVAFGVSAGEVYRSMPPDGRRHACQHGLQQRHSCQQKWTRTCRGKGCRSCVCIWSSPA
eukprot:880897-Rhodomonas_salina.4